MKAKQKYLEPPLNLPSLNNSDESGKPWEYPKDCVNLQTDVR